MLMPASLAISSKLVLAYPWRARTRIAASMICWELTALFAYAMNGDNDAWRWGSSTACAKAAR